MTDFRNLGKSEGTNMAVKMQSEFILQSMEGNDVITWSVGAGKFYLMCG